MHKRIGIIGGLSPESTVSYYLHITRTYVDRFGDHGYPEIVIYSVSMEKYHRWRAAERWDLIAGDLIAAAKGLEHAGADFGVIATNTMHKVFDLVSAAVDLPLLHMIDATVRKAKTLGLKKLGLLGTQTTMCDGFYQAYCEHHGLQMVVPPPKDQEIVHKVIVDELVRGRLFETSRVEYMRIIHDLADLGAEGIVLGLSLIHI